jgi:5-formyltetrahydrofolate cyclo-ligase
VEDNSRLENTDKEQARLEIRQRLNLLSLDERKAKSLSTSTHLQNFIIQLGRPESLGVYWPLRDEVDWSLNWTLESTELYFPGEDPKQGMQFYRADFDEFEIRESQFGKKMKVPLLNALAGIPKALVIPGVGFDLQGRRLGRGGGFYDRYLENFQGLRIGVCFACQLVSHLPEELHDQRMDAIVTEDRVVRPSS